MRMAFKNGFCRMFYAMLVLTGGWLAGAEENVKPDVKWVLDRQGQKPEPRVAVQDVTAWPNLTRLNDGTILLSYGNRAHPGVEVMFSSDEGKTWSEPYRLLDVNSGDSGYPNSVHRKEGQVVTAYYAKGTPAHKGYHMGVVIWDPAKTRAQP